MGRSFVGGPRQQCGGLRPVVEPRRDGSRFWPPTQESYESESASEAGVIGAFGGSG